LKRDFLPPGVKARPQGLPEKKSVKSGACQKRAAMVALVLQLVSGNLKGAEKKKGHQTATSDP